MTVVLPKSPLFPYVLSSVIFCLMLIPCVTEEEEEEEDEEVEDEEVQINYR